MIDISDCEGADAPVFNAQEWIGLGKIWNDPMPVQVHQARSAARRIPDGIVSVLIPDKSVSVQELLVQSVRCNSSADGAKYNTDLPNTLTGDPHSAEFRHLLSQYRYTLLASLNNLPSLRQQFNSAWLSGAQSIHLPNDPLVCFPLWIEHLLSELDSYSRKEKAWTKASDWLQSTVGHSPDESITGLAGDCFKSWNHVPWDGVVPGLGRAVVLSTKDLAKFLSNEWLNDDMINAGISWISHHVSSNRRIRILNVFFVDALRNLHSTQNSYDSRRHQPLDRLITNNQIDMVYAPLHVHGNHWTLLRIDLEARQYAYGDSLYPSARAPPGDVLDLLTWWLDSLAPGPSLSPSSHGLVVPQQEDTYSCGIIVLSTLACKLVDECGPWEQQFHASKRMEWYLRLSERFRNFNDVSRKSSVRITTKTYIVHFIATNRYPETQLIISRTWWVSASWDISNSRKRHGYSRLSVYLSRRCFQLRIDIHPQQILFSA